MTINKIMVDKNKDELIEAQKQVIGILFEVIKRLQANNDLDEEYFQIISLEDNAKNEKINTILEKRTENTKIVSRLLEQLEV
jgi:hypothetical protein